MTERKQLAPDELLKNLYGIVFEAKTEKDRKSIELLTFLYNKGLINRVEAQLVLAEYDQTQESVGSILIGRNFIRQEDYLAAIIEHDPDYVMNETAISEEVSYEFLERTSTMIQAETREQIFISTLGDEEYVKNYIQELIPNKEIVIKPANPEYISEYLVKISKIEYSEEGELDKLIMDAIKKDATDIHIKAPKGESFTIMYRVDGVLRPEKEWSVDKYKQLKVWVKERAKLVTEKTDYPQDGSFQIENKGRFIDFRVATTPVGAGGFEKIVIRILDPDRINPILDSLGIRGVDKWRKGVSARNGIALICGPTGSGKTTTLRSSIMEMDRYGKQIYTVEDPIEYNIPFVDQIEVNTAVGLDFNRALKALLRLDPDIIMVGEIRDEETARLAIKAAETGHMVIGTLHANSIISIKDRFRDIGVNANELQHLLRTVLVQELIRVYCSECGGKGCSNCGGTGYKGRTVISECEYFNDHNDVKRLIQDEEITYTTILEDAVEKCFIDGVTGEDEILRIYGEQGKQAIERFIASQ